MRIRLVGLAAVSLLLMSACGTPDGVDGNLTDGWPPMADAKIPIPAAAACYNVATDDPSTVTKWPAPVGCTEAHTVETAYVGEFDAGIDRTAPPSAGSAGRRGAYEKCAAEAKTFLGDDWRAGRLDLFLVLPIALHWQAGARWYRCDLVEYEDLNTFPVVPRTASLKDALGGDRPVGLGCVAVVVNGKNEIDKINPSACDVRHNGEFVGVAEMPDGPYPVEATAASKARLDACATVVAAYANVPQDAELQGRIGWIAVPFSEVSWALGNRGLRCYGHSADPLNASIKGIGPTGLPVD